MNIEQAKLIGLLVPKLIEYLCRVNAPPSPHKDLSTAYPLESFDDFLNIVRLL